MRQRTFSFVNAIACDVHAEIIDNRKTPASLKSHGNCRGAPTCLLNHGHLQDHPNFHFFLMERIAIEKPETREKFT